MKREDDRSEQHEPGGVARLCPRFSRVLAGPYATQVLANLGANVVKVEFPSGDPARAIGPFIGDRSLYFSSVNTGKRAVLLDPTSEEGQSLLRDLLVWADVVVHNFRTDAAIALGLQPATLLGQHGGLVVVTISDYASETSDAGRHEWQFLTGL